MKKRLSDMEQKEVNTLYDGISYKYDQYWFSNPKSEVYQNYVNYNVQELNQLNENSIIIDYGGGDGTFAECLQKQFNFKIPPLVIDPSRKMIEKAKQKNNINTYLIEQPLTIKDKNSFPQQYQQVDAIFLKECIQHIPENQRVEILNLLKSMLKDDGKIVMQTRPNYQGNFPFPLCFKNVWFNYNLIEVFDNLTRECQLNGDMHTYTQTVKLKKQEWFNFIKNKGFVQFCEIDDKEIEDGIKELKQKYQDQDYVEFQDLVVIIYLTKRD